MPSAGTSIDVAASLPAGFNAPPGFLTPAYIPAGYRLTGFEQARQGEAIVRISRSYENSEKEGLHFSESLRPSGLSKTDTAGVPVQFAGAIAYCSSFTLTFASGNLVVGITAPELSLDEVVRVADSMR